VYRVCFSTRLIRLTYLYGKSFTCCMSMLILDSASTPSQFTGENTISNREN
jgi:hypothetical protein